MPGATWAPPPPCWAEDLARQWLQDSLDLAQVVSDAPQEVFCRGHLGHLALSEGDFDEAERQLQAAYSLSRRADTVNYATGSCAAWPVPPSPGRRKQGAGPRRRGAVRGPGQPAGR
ncbi:MAG: tetratricopeptide repeat protein [Caldilineaceae bacterium]